MCASTNQSLKKTSRVSNPPVWLKLSRTSPDRLSFRCRLSFVRFLLAKIGNRFRRLPERIVQRPVELRSVIDANGLRNVCRSRFHLTC